MANIMSLKNLTNKVHREGFDLSRNNLFTAKVGPLYPVFCQEVIPGDKFKININSFTRTQPLNTAAYSRIREYYDFFFVPYRLLWNKFDDFITQVSQPQQANSIENPASTNWSLSPYLDSAEISYLLRSAYVYEASNNKGIDTFNYSFTQNSIQLLNYLGYGDFSLIKNDDYSQKIKSIALSPWRLLAYQKIYHDFYRDSQWENAKPQIYNVDYLNNKTYTKVPINQYPFYDLQNNPPANINTDSIFTLRYANYNKDLYLGVLPSAQYGSESFAPIHLESSNIRKNIIESSDNNQYHDPRGNVLQSTEAAHISWSDGYLYDASFDELVHHSHNVDLTDIDANLSILALRQAQCLQKWKEIANSGSRDYQTQIFKHWNVKPSDERSHKCKYLGGQSSTIQISEVINTNFDNANSQAEIKGRGIGNNSQYINFDNGNGSAEYGVIIGIYHAAPIIDYQATGIDSFNTKVTPTSYAIPEFDNIGMQTQTTDVVLGYDAELINNKPVSYGYVPRYAEYKTDVDKYHGGFIDSFKNWVIGLDLNDLTSRLMPGNSTQFSYLGLKINPKVMNNIFLAQIQEDDAENNMSYDNEQLLINMSASVSAVRNLDYNGLPY